MGTVAEPLFENVSDARVFLGVFDGHDLYFDPQMGIPTVIARFGNDGPDYTSGIVPEGGPAPLIEAKRLAVEKGLLILPEDEGLDDRWRPASYPQTLVPYLVQRWGTGQFELRIQRWGWKPYSAGGWRWDLKDPNAPFQIAGFGYCRSAPEAETILEGLIKTLFNLEKP